MRPNCLMVSGFYCRGGSEGLFHAWLGNISAQWQPFTHPITHTLADPSRGPVREESYKRRRFLLLVSCRPSHVLDSPVRDHIWWAGGTSASGVPELGVNTTTMQHFRCVIKMSQNLWFASSYTSTQAQTVSIRPRPLHPILPHQPQYPSTVPFAGHPLDISILASLASSPKPLTCTLMSLRCPHSSSFLLPPPLPPVFFRQAFNQNGPVGCAWRLFFFSQTRAKKEEEAVRDRVKKLSDPCRGVTGLLLSVKNKAFWVYHHQYEWIMLSMCVLWVPWKAHHKSKLLLWLLQ